MVILTNDARIALAYDLALRVLYQDTLADGKSEMVVQKLSRLMTELFDEDGPGEWAMEEFGSLYETILLLLGYAFAGVCERPGVIPIMVGSIRVLNQQGDFVVELEEVA